MEIVQILRLVVAYRRRVLPFARMEIARWETVARQHPERADLALAKIAGERRNVEAAAFFALLAGRDWRESARRVIAFQLAYEYLDGLNEQHPELTDGIAMHTSLCAAVGAGIMTGKYDSGYLAQLVVACRRTVPRSATLAAAAHRVGEAQARNHAGDGLQRWAEHAAPSLAWWEGAAAGISSLDILAMLATPPSLHEHIARSYLEVCALSGLLDGLVDQATDEPENHNWISHYASRGDALGRLAVLAGQAEESLAGLPGQLAHRMILAGLIAHNLVIADPEARRRLSSSAAYVRPGMLLFHLS